MKGFSSQLKYYGILIASLLSVFGGIGLGTLCLLLLLQQNTIGAILSGLGALIFLIIYRLLADVRLDARDEMEFDNFGGNKRNRYRNLSTKQRQVIDVQRLADAERIISSSELKSRTHKGSKDPEAELNSLIGLNNIKEEVLRIKAKVEYDKRMRKQLKSSSEGLHMCFMGSPGTGKTTVARIMAGVLYKYGRIKDNKYMEVDAAFLKGSTPDETLKRTYAVLNNAQGGVLFIDEAYSLLSGINSAELIALLVKYMEDHKKDFVLILAGYENDMKRLIDSNPGLQSRIHKYFHFRDYSITELTEIFTAVANAAGYCVEDKAYEHFQHIITQQKSSKNFGNARNVRKIFQCALDAHAYNVMNKLIPEDKLFVITGSDVIKK